MLERALEEHSLEVRRRLFAHQDYFGNIIPSSWFVLGTLTGAFVFYQNQLQGVAKAVREFIEPFGEPSTGVDIFLAVVLLMAAFNVIYILGQLLNGLAAILLDRIILKKLLQYPFTLYELKWTSRHLAKLDSALFRDAMLNASYGVFCVNLIPVVFFELSLLAFALQNPRTDSWVHDHEIRSLISSAVLVVIHFGIPSISKARDVCRSTLDAKDMTVQLVIGHILLIVVGAVILAMAVVANGFTWFILLLPIANFAMALGDRKMVKQYGMLYKTPAMRCVFMYARRTFVNPAYFAAKLVGYGSGPAAELIGKALQAARYGSAANDFYWMCQLRVENDAPRTYDTAYHGMAMYTMNRNLCNATAIVIVISLIEYYIHWPDNYRHMPLFWIAALCVITYAFFIRFLYLFSGAYSKYIIRAAAFVTDREQRVIVEPSGA